MRRVRLTKAYLLSETHKNASQPLGNYMQNLLIAFITGLTTGGLSCLAVQGGLLASSLGNQIEKDLQVSTLQTKRQKKKITTAQPAVHHGIYRPEFALPILAFLA